MAVLEYLLNNWYIWMAILCVTALVVIGIISFIRLPKSEQLGKIKEWLLWAVTNAEKELGSGTGELKLSMVYDMFIGRFPAFAKNFSFETFSLLVDEALETMRELLENNENINKFVNTGEISK